MWHLVAIRDYQIFDMAILKISFVLMIISCLNVTNTEDVRLEENVDDNTFEKIKEMTVVNISLFQTFYRDRGYIARRTKTLEEHLMTDYKIVRNYFSTLEKELECSFVFSALVHVYLTNVNSPEQKNLTFTEEAAYMVDYAFVRKNKKLKLLEVMWLVYLCNSQTDELIESFEIGHEGVDYKNILSTSNAALEKVLEEFTESYECKVYDQETCEVQEVKYVDKIKEVMKGQKTGVPLTLEANKERFLIQRSHTLSSFISKEDSGLGLEQLRLSHLMKDTDAIDDLIKTYGVQVDSGPIVEHLLKCYQETYNVNVPLYEYIDSFITLQSDVITTFKAMALRIVIVYLKIMKQTLASSSMLKQVYYLVGSYSKYNQKMITLLREFASLVGQPDDQHLQKVIQIFNPFFYSYFVDSWFDDNISSVFILLKDMTSDNRILSVFSDPLVVNDSGMIVDFDEIVKKYSAICIEDLDLVQKIIAVIVIYIRYLNKINGGIDLRVYSIICLKESDHYKRLVDIETDDKKKKENKNFILP